MIFHILYGPPGAGKTTLSESFSNNIAYISMGAITRQEISSNSHIGRDLQSYLDRVVEYPSSLVQQVVSQALEREHADTIVFDGFPKFQREVPILANLLDSTNSLAGNAVVLEISLEEAIKRMSVRRICPRCSRQFGRFQETVCPACTIPLARRDDDTIEAFTLRFKDYLANNQMIVTQLQMLGFTLKRLKSEDITVEDFLNCFRPE